MKRFMVVFENAPLQSAPWIASACAATRLFLVSNDAIADELSKSEEARKAILNTKQEPWGIAEGLTPFYRAALETLAGSHARLGLSGTNWLVYAEKPDLCILDFDPLEAEGQRGMKQGVTAKAAADYVKTYSDELLHRAKKHLAADHILVLPKGTADAKKSELAVAFLRKFDR